MRQEVYFDNIRNQIIQNLSSCELELKIAVAWFTDKQIIKEVNKLISDGVDVEIIIYNDHINQKELFKDLYYSKAKIWLSKKMMHNKFCVIDNNIVINGSYNWTNNASTNEENIQVSHNNKDLALQFSKQFEQLTKSCSPIDNFFEYSLSSLSKLDYEFADYCANWPNYSFPYFIDTTNLKPSKINDSIKFGGTIYFITDREVEKKLLYIQFLIDSKYSIRKIFNIWKQKIEYPNKFDFVHDLTLDYNSVAEFRHTTYTVENKGSLFQIDSSGNIISEKFPFTHKYNDDLFLQSISGMYSNLKPHFFNKKFEKIPIPYYVHGVHSNLIVVSNSEKRFNIGVIDSSNKLVIPFLYDGYGRTFNEINLELIEYPIFNRNSSGDWLEITNHDYNSFVNVDHIIHFFSKTNLKLVEQKRIKGKKTTETDDFIFLSEENYKYKSFYHQIREHRFEGNRFRNLIRPDYLKVKEFDTLKKNFNNPSMIKFYLKQFENDRENNQRIKAAESKKNEGCYIATMVYESYDHPNVILLREFREKKLNTNYLGKIFIKGYYRYSPKYVQFVKDKRFMRLFSSMFVKGIVKILKNMA
ncbi:phospholipase D-like domain-containing protein [Pedobacter helvus]|uniref:phospholipase D n=1 Tax=Pedobacter helvus TaxID=2563444 RepID=A0ABW9JI45_9SPHI|nr:phospholipase D-like domain-containing protein [Pedobacter ureilyticus]